MDSRHPQVRFGVGDSACDRPQSIPTLPSHRQLRATLTSVVFDVEQTGVDLIVLTINIPVDG